MHPQRIVWLCHFNNRSINQLVNPQKDKQEFAPWISLLIKLMKNRDDIEIHVVSPNIYNSNYLEFNESNIHYHLFSINVPFVNIPWPWFITFTTSFIWNKLQVRRIINRIKPDLIHLHGAENPYYSSSILQFIGKYPILVTIQGFITHTNASGFIIRKKKMIEHTILKRVKHFGIRADFMSKTIQKFNKDATFHFHNYPVNKIENFNSCHTQDKKYDVVYFANISKDKGIEDLIEALSDVKINKPDISAVITGRCDSRYLKIVQKLISRYNLDKNIILLGFIPTQAELFKTVLTARICVLPTYHDIIPGTVIESMIHGIPVVSYEVGGLPDLNKEIESVKLVEKGDIAGLAEAIINLLEDYTAYTKYKENGYQTAKKYYDHSQIINDLLDAYTQVFFDFYKSAKPSLNRI